MEPATNALAWRALLTAFLAAACVTDVRARRIPNALVLAVLVTGLGRAALVAAGTSGAGAVGFATGPGGAMLGTLCGLLLWMPLYAIRAFGAGDVKLFAAAGAWLGPAAVPHAALDAALAGGVLGLAWLATTHATRLAPALAPRALAAHAFAPASDRTSRVPYGIAIAAGVLAVVWGVA